MRCEHSACLAVERLGGIQRVEGGTRSISLAVGPTCVHDHTPQVGYHTATFVNGELAHGRAHLGWLPRKNIGPEFVQSIRHGRPGPTSSPRHPGPRSKYSTQSRCMGCRRDRCDRRQPSGGTSSPLFPHAPHPHGPGQAVQERGGPPLITCGAPHQVRCTPVRPVDQGARYHLLQ
jgi:hypothetical protein